MCRACVQAAAAHALSILAAQDVGQEAMVEANTLPALLEALHATSDSDAQDAIVNALGNRLCSEGGIGVRHRIAHRSWAACASCWRQLAGVLRESALVCIACAGQRCNSAHNSWLSRSGPALCQFALSITRSASVLRLLVGCCRMRMWWVPATRPCPGCGRCWPVPAPAVARLLLLSPGTSRAMAGRHSASLWMQARRCLVTCLSADSMFRRCRRL